MQSECSSTCGFCTSEPTVSPICADAYTYCKEAALAGACHDNDYEARLHFTNDCPASCNTCYNQSMTPTFSPTFSPTLLPTAPTSSPSLNPSYKPNGQPTRAPTNSPTCLDLIGYCGYVEDYCNSTELSIQVKMQDDCSNTCGFCIGESEENLAEDVRRRLAVTEQSPTSTDLAILLVLVFSLAVSLTLLLRYVLARSYENLSLDRKDALCELTHEKITFPGPIVEQKDVLESAPLFTALAPDGVLQ